MIQFRVRLFCFFTPGVRFLRSFFKEKLDLSTAGGVISEERKGFIVGEAAQQSGIKLALVFGCADR